MFFIVQISPFVHLFTLEIVFRWGGEGLGPPDPLTRATVCPGPAGDLKPDPSLQVVPTFHLYILIKIIINNKCIQVSHLQKAPRDGTKWKLIPTCAWCRIDTQFIWKICNRHQGTVPQKDVFPMPTANHPMSLNFYIIEERIFFFSFLFEPSLNHILTKSLKYHRTFIIQYP